MLARTVFAFALLALGSQRMATVSKIEINGTKTGHVSSIDGVYGRTENSNPSLSSSIFPGSVITVHRSYGVFDLAYLPDDWVVIDASLEIDVTEIRETATFQVRVASLATVDGLTHEELLSVFNETNQVPPGDNESVFIENFTPSLGVNDFTVNADLDEGYPLAAIQHAIANNRLCVFGVKRQGFGFTGDISIADDWVLTLTFAHTDDRRAMRSAFRGVMRP